MEQQISTSSKRIKQMFAFRNKLKMRKKDFDLLCEAYRRKNLMRTKLTYNSCLGLGMPSIYNKSKFFKVLDGRETPKVLNWYVLTNEGIEALKALEAEIGIPNDIEEINYMNITLFEGY